MSENLFQDQEYRLWAMIVNARNALFLVRRKELAKYKLSIMHAHVLAAIKFLEATESNVTPANLARCLILEPHSVSETLSRMVEKNLVRKYKDLDRKNLVRVEITEKGHEAIRQSQSRDSLHRILSTLSEEQQEQLYSCLQILREKAFEELGIEQYMPYTFPK